MHVAPKTRCLRLKLLKGKFSSKFVIFIILTLVLVNIPIFGNYIKIINTVIHESGHALMALFGGKVQHISLFLNTEGVTYTSHSGWFGGFLTGVSGYVFSSFFAFLAFWKNIRCSLPFCLYLSASISSFGFVISTAFFG